MVPDDWFCEGCSYSSQKLPLPDGLSSVHLLQEHPDVVRGLRLGIRRFGYHVDLVERERLQVAVGDVASAMR